MGQSVDQSGSLEPGGGRRIASNQTGGESFVRFSEACGLILQTREVVKSSSGCIKV